ncbi:MAG: hypothetical protein ACPG8V_00180 [Alphaproteobacteria bacterium]
MKIRYEVIGLVIMFIAVFLASVSIGVIIDDMVVASMPILLFWLYVMNNTFKNMEEF